MSGSIRLVESIGASPSLVLAFKSLGVNAVPDVSPPTASFSFGFEGPDFGDEIKKKTKKKKPRKKSAISEGDHAKGCELDKIVNGDSTPTPLREQHTHAVLEMEDGCCDAAPLLPSRLPAPSSSSTEEVKQTKKKKSKKKGVPAGGGGSASASASGSAQVSGTSIANLTDMAGKVTAGMANKKKLNSLKDDNDFLALIAEAKLLNASLATSKPPATASSIKSRGRNSGSSSLLVSPPSSTSPSHLLHFKSHKDPELDDLERQKRRYGNGKNLVAIGPSKIRDPTWLEGGILGTVIGTTIEGEPCSLPTTGPFSFGFSF